MAFFDLSSLDPRRRRLAEQAPAGDDDMALTPGFNPDASAPAGLPNAPVSRPLPALARNVPGAAPPSNMPGPAAPPLIGDPPVKTRPHQIADARADYLAETPGRGRSTLHTMLRGAVDGVRSGGIAGAIRGAVGGAAFGALDPRGAREEEFNQKVLPKIQERFGYEDADLAQQMATRKAGREDQLAQANIANANSEIEDRQARRRLPMIIPQGGAAMDPQTLEVIEMNQRPGTPHWEATTEGYQDLNAPGNKGKVFQPYNKQTNPPEQSYRDTNQLQQLKQTAARAWSLWNTMPEGPEKEREKQKATDAQAAYKEAVRQFGDKYPEFFETGGFEGGANGDIGWPYYKRRQGQGGGQPAPSARPQGGQSQPRQGGGTTRARSEFNSSKFPGISFD